MAIYVKHGRFMMAKAFHDYAFQNGKCTLWFGFGRGYMEADAAWNNLQEINGGTAITADVPPPPIMYPSPNSKKLSNLDSSGALPQKYYSSTDFPPVVYKRGNVVQYIHPDPSGSIVYLDANYSAYATEAEAKAADCNLVRVNCTLSAIELQGVGYSITDFITRQIGLYNDVDSVMSAWFPTSTHPNLVRRTDLPTGKSEVDMGLCMVENTLPYGKVDYQRDEFSFVLQF